MAKLRFAPLIRVSTERQERQGESLNTQRKQIIAYIEQLGGTIPKRCWKYSGQEHATINSERQNLDQLLSDSGKNLFDAVIVCDASRWSRDNLKSKQGLQILRDNKIKFFVGSTEFDLFSPQSVLFLGMSTEMNEFFGMEQCRKAMFSKLDRARKNIPTCGRLPYGRTFDRSNNQWGLIKEKADLIKDAADKYLAGTHKIEDLSKLCKMRSSSLWRIFRTRLGDTWEVSFESSRLNIDETITYKIPPLLPKAKIKAIRNQITSNRTSNHGYGKRKNKYLLSRMVFCKKCGQTLYACNDKGHRYYRHKIKCPSFTYVHANLIEADILLQVFHLIGDEIGFKKAVEAAIPNQAGIEKDQLRLQQIGFELKKITTKKNRLVDAVMNATLDNDTVKSRMQKLEDQGQLFNIEKQHLMSKLDNLPTQIEIDQRFKYWKRFLHDIYTLDHDHLLEMTYDQKREMLQAFFNGTDSDGNRLGVYIDHDAGSDKPFRYEIRGILPYIETGRIGEPPFNFEYDQEREGFENTRDQLSKQVSRCQVNPKSII